jgi:lipoyl synthase
VSKTPRTETPPPAARLRKPPWLRVKLPQGEAVERLRAVVDGLRLHTVCQEALCPNLGLCWGHGRATLMILGGTCTRGCSFCNVTGGRPAGCDFDEPARVGAAVKEMGLRDVVITSVTRDDLPDGGASLWAETVRTVRAAVPGVMIEVLVPDFGGSAEALAAVVAARPDVLGHNLETVKSLYPRVRPQASYPRSLELLSRAHAAGMIAKTSVMVGLGERPEEVRALMEDARSVGCEILFIGQYLQPSRRHMPVARYVEPAEFDAWRERGLAMGFTVVVSAPLVRSSYHSDEQERHVAASVSHRPAGRRCPGP